MMEKLRDRDLLREVARETGRQEDWTVYRAARNACVKDVQRSKEKHYTGLYSKIEVEKDSKKLFKLTGELLDIRAGNLPQRLLKDGKLINKPAEMADHQLNYYNDKVRKLRENLSISNRNPLELLEKAMNTWEERDARPLFNFKRINRSDVLILIKSLSNSEAFGLDGLDAVALKTVAEEISAPVQHLINLSLSTGKFAKKWKIAKVTPRLKSKDLNRYETSSYRPVAILSTVSKLVERTAQQQLLGYLEDTKQLSGSNHAYRSLHSTTTTLIEIMDELFEGAEMKKKSSALLIDQSSAFDVVEHQLLLKKLKIYNVGRNALEWIEDYLTSRSQFVSIGGGGYQG